MKKAIGLLATLTSSPIWVAAAMAEAPSSPTTAATSSPGQPDVPPALMAVYAGAAASCPGLPWQVVAAIGTVESDNGRSTLAGVHSGANPAGAEGPMQMEPATFAAYDLPVPPGGVDPPSPYDPVDSAWAAVRMLCHDGGSDPRSLGQAIYDYNHSAAYVASVLSVAASYGLGAGAGRGGLAVNYALAQVGTPYHWGAEEAGVGFDCSGLAQAAWAAAGVALPRVAEQQFSAGPAVAPGAALQPGDLVFFGAGMVADHVGIVVDPSGTMVDAPHTGAEVRVEPFPEEPGAMWGSERYLGATRPG